MKLRERAGFWALLLAMAGGLPLVACGSIPPAPGNFDPQGYRAVTLAELQAPRLRGLHPGEKVKVDGYFWQLLEYDPKVGANYLTLLRQPAAWLRLRWAALYASSDMHGYYDRLALERDQVEKVPLQRLQAVRVFGELAPLGFGVLYLRAHHLEPLEEGFLGTRGRTGPKEERESAAP